MPHVESAIKTQRIICLKKYTENYHSPWKLILSRILKDHGEKFLLHCNYNGADLPKHLPKFYRECFETWATVNTKEMSSRDVIMDQILWNNQFLRIGGKPQFCKKSYMAGIVKIKDILLPNGKLKTWNFFREKGLNFNNYFLILGLSKALPDAWRVLINSKNPQPPDAQEQSTTTSLDLTQFVLNCNNEEIKLSELTSKRLYWILIGNIHSVCETDPFSCGDKGVCTPDYQGEGFECNCNNGHAGKPCKPKSCSRLLEDGATSSGIYTNNPDGGKPIQVFCDMTTDGGGWTVFQKRLDGSVDFYLGWKFYKNGFGDLSGEFWLGNDNLHRLTAGDDVILRVDLEDFDENITYAEYTTFKVADEGDKYRLLIGGYNGTAGDSISFSSNMQFSTKDSDNDLWSNHCAKMFKGVWWYRTCHRSNRNGLYLKGPHSSFANGVNWRYFRGYYYSLKRTEMKVKPKPVQ
ncbi:uncharacterized protein LOC144637638 [Oculina patagonica]